MLSSRINLKALIASTFCASKEETRYYLCGVYTHVEAAERYYVSTDGVVLTKITEVVGAADSVDDGLIIPLPTIAMLKKLAETIDPRRQLWGRADFLSLCKEELKDGNGKTAALKYYFLFHVNGGQRLDFQPIDGNFPDYKRVFPDKGASVTRTEICVAPPQLEQIGKAYVAYTGRKDYVLELEFTGDSHISPVRVITYCANLQALAVPKPPVEPRHKMKYGFQEADND